MSRGLPDQDTVEWPATPIPVSEDGLLLSNLSQHDSVAFCRMTTTHVCLVTQWRNPIAEESPETFSPQPDCAIAIYSDCWIWEKYLQSSTICTCAWNIAPAKLTMIWI